MIIEINLEVWRQASASTVLNWKLDHAREKRPMLLPSSGSFLYCRVICFSLCCVVLLSHKWGKPSLSDILIILSVDVLIISSGQHYKFKIVNSS